MYRTNLIVLSLSMAVVLLAFNIQHSVKFVKAASWDSNIEEWLNGNARPYVLICHLALLGNQLASPSLAEETGNTDQLKRCDNNLLIIKKDVCPSHNNAFPVCKEPKLDEYITKRGLDSAKTPNDWMREPTQQ